MEEGLGPGVVAVVGELSPEEEDELGSLWWLGAPPFFSWYLGACSKGVGEFDPSIYQFLHFLWEA